METVKLSPDEISAQHLKTLEAFVMRARRIEAHSICADAEALVKLAQLQLDLEHVPGEGAFLVRAVPPEEQIESAAARIRPLLLQDHGIHYSRVLGSLKFFLKDDVALSEVLKSIRAEWMRIKDGTDLLGMKMFAAAHEDDQLSAASDLELAFAYFYGDVVHHDASRRSSTAAFGVKHRYQMAASVVARVVVLTLSTLNLTRKANIAGLIQLAENVLTDPVVVEETVLRFPVEAAFIAPPGTPPPDSFNVDESVWTRQMFTAGSVEQPPQTSTE